MGASLKHNNVLTTLLLHGNGMGPEAGHAFAQALLLNTSLAMMDLQENEVGMEAAAALAVAFKKHPRLTTLTSLIGPQQTELKMHIAPDDCVLLAAELATNSSVQTLTLSMPPSAAGAAIAVVEALHMNTTVRSLGFTGGCVDAKAGKAIGSALRVNKTLTDVRLRHNNLGAEGVKEITDALLSNHTLTSLDLAFNRVPRSADDACDRDAIKRYRADKKAVPLTLQL